MKRARILQWIFIATFLFAGTGGYLWYRASAGVSTNNSPIPSEVSASGLVGYWTFDGADYSSSTVITDSSGNSHSGTLTNSPTRATGKWGQALDFPGSNQYVSVGTVYNGVKTVAFWVWADNTTKNIIDLNATATIDVSSGTIRGNNFTSPTIYIDGVASSTPTIDTTGWHFVAITTGTGINASAVDIGRISTGYFDGRLDDVRMYSSELSASEVYQLYTAGSAKVNAPVEDPLSQSLRGYWKLDDGSGTNATDASGNANTLAMTGSPSWTTGNIGPYALDFSGTGQYLSVADPSSGVLDFVDGADFSISGWFNRDTFTANHTIVAKKTNQTTNAGYVVWIDASTDTVNFEISDGTDTYEADSATAFTATGWHHFVAVWDDSNGAYVYIDGGLNGSTTSSTSSIDDLSNANAFRIGAESDDDNPFDGKLDDIRIYGYSLSTDQVKKLYSTTSPTQPVDTSLVGHWTFDGNDIQGSTAIDRSSFGNNGTITGAVPMIGKLGQALSFDGTDDRISFGDVLDIGDTDDISIAGWFNNISFSDCRVLVAKKIDYGNLVGYTTYIGNNPDVFIFKVSDGSDSYSVNSTMEFTTPGWHHFVAVWDQDSESGTRVYIDGSDASGSRSGTIGNVGDPSSSNPYSLTIGTVSSNDQCFFQGRIDDVRIYNRVLSASEVLNLYDLGK